jgi:hypothetical protein
MKIIDLIVALEDYDFDENVLVTFEGITRDISVYQAKDSTVLIDADDNFYKEDFLSGKKTTLK